MRFRLLRLLDSVAHFLYCPAMLGRRSARARWYHRIHLIPGFVLAWVCDRYELALGVTPDELHRTAGAYDWADDPSLADGEVMRRFETLEPAKIVGVHGYRCPHFELTYANAVPAGPPSAGCGCTMQPVYR